MLERPTRFVVQRLKARVKSSRTVRNVLYDRKNSEEFGNLFEHEKMLADSVRVDAYSEAIARHVTSDDVVMDLGTGTGVLAMLAARRQPKHIYAIDHSPFIEVARLITDQNGLDNITFVQENSRSFTPPEKVDVILHEQMGDDLFNENMLGNLLDLKRRVLQRTGRIVPGRFELFIEPVSLKPEFKVPYLWEHQTNGLEFGFLKDSAELTPYKRPDYEVRFVRACGVAHFLGDPKPALVVDLNQITNVQELPTAIEESRNVVRAGTLDGFCLYFRVIFDDEIGFSTSPLDAPTHWGNRLFRAAQQTYTLGEKLSYRVVLDDLTRVMTWSVTPI